jgi:hypothetical protein
MGWWGAGIAIDTELESACLVVPLDVFRMFHIWNIGVRYGRHANVGDFVAGANVDKERIFAQLLFALVGLARVPSFHVETINY